jgi:hypothetical protein
VSFEKGDVYVDDSGEAVIDMTVYTYDLYDMVDIATLNENDVIVRLGEEVTVTELERLDSGLVRINGGEENGGFELISNDNTVFFEIGMSDMKAYYELGKVTLPVSTEFVYTDASDLEAEAKEYYAGDFLSMYEDNDSLAFSVPKEGTNIFVDAMCIPKGSKNKEIAEMYINFMLEKEIGRANSEFVYYSTPNRLVNEDEEYKETMSEVHENAMEYIAPEFIKDGYTGNYVTSYYNNLDEGTLALMNSLWEELKIKGESGNGIYIACGVILLGVASLGVVKFIKNKRRLY